jgi:hypothetical protein
LGQAAAAAAAAAGAAGGDPAKGGVGYASMSSRGLPVWLATALQIGGLFLLGMLGYVIACCFLEVRHCLFFILAASCKKCLHGNACCHAACFLEGTRCAASRRCVQHRTKLVLESCTMH